jgi:outer membrane protein assembly factor BamB/tetratricopeptide (TPR) repeat protein
LRFALLALALVVSPSTVRADDPPPAAVFPGEGKATAKRLDEARKLIVAKKWDEALEEFQAILETGGDDLVPIDARESVQARRLCHALIAALPAEALTAYRKRVDPQAQSWLDVGAARHDEVLLRKIVDQMFCSTPGERAVDLLGDLAFERGLFDEALAWWRLLEPSGDRKEPGGPALAYPGAKITPALIQAKQLLARLYQGSIADWDAELKAYRDRHGRAEGTLAGSKGIYADLLADLARRHARGEKPLVEWTTFGGDARRSLVPPTPPRFLDRLSGLCQEGPTWRFDLQERKAAKATPRRGERVASASTWAREMAFHPLIVWPHLLVADARYVTAFDLRNGKAETWYDAARFNGGIKPNLKLPTPITDLRYTLTVAEGCLFARLGAQTVRDVQPDPDKRDAEAEANNESLLVCLSLKPGKGGDRLRWQARAIDKGHAVFEGAPVVRDGLVYIAATRVTGDRTTTAIQCYPVEANTVPPLRWSVDVCETRELQGEKNKERTRHHLLTLAGRALVYCSHSGAIVAVDARTGQRLWAVRYPIKVDKSAEAAFRDLMPCIAAAGRLYVAPADSDRILCLDPTTGVVLWEYEGVQVVQLLGVAHGKLIFTTGRRPVDESKPYGLRAIDATDGDDDPEKRKGWYCPTDGGLTPMGRGLLIGDLVLWPTDQTSSEHPGCWVKAVRQSDGDQPDDPTLLHQVPVGNLVYADGCLAVADREGVSVFVPPEKRLDEIRKEADVEDKPGTASLRRARGEAGAGHFDEAIKVLERIEKGDNAALREKARCERWRVLLEQGRYEVKIGGLAGKDAIASLLRSARKEFPPSARLKAIHRAAEVLEKTGTREDAASPWLRALAEPQLRNAPIVDDKGNLRLGASIALEEIRRLSPGKSEASKADFQRTIDAALDAGRLEEVEMTVEQFPYLTASSLALIELAKRYTKEDRPGAAACAYRRLLTRTTARELRAVALIGLARAYEHQRAWPAARLSWERLAREQGGSKRTELDPERTVSEFVEEHLKTDGFVKRKDEKVVLPFLRTTHLNFARDEISLPVEAGDLEPVEGLVFSCSSGELVCHVLGSSKQRWRCRLDFAAVWAGCHADCILAAGERGVACVRLEDGRLLWRWFGPFPDGWPLDGWPRDTPHDESVALTDFQLCAGRLFLMQGRHRLFAFDAETGQGLWSARAPNAQLRLLPPRGRFAPGYAVNETTVLVQTTAGPRWLLDAATGKRLLATKERAWQRPPCLLDDGDLCVLANVRQVQRLDPATGKPRWVHRIVGSTTLTGEGPQVLAGAGRIVLLTATNVGYRIQRLHPATGKPLWLRAPLLRQSGVDIHGWSIDDSALYYVLENVLYARSLQDGKVLWEQPLSGPVGSWRTRRVGEVLLAWPEGDRKQFQFRWLLGAVQWTLSLPCEAIRGEGTPVLCCDAATGKLIQRLNFPADRPRAQTATISPRERSVMPRLRVARGEPVRTPTIQVSHKGMVVALGGQVVAFEMPLK